MKINKYLTIASSSLLLATPMLAASGVTEVTEKITEITNGTLEVNSDWVRKNAQPIVTWDLTSKDTLNTIFKRNPDGPSEVLTDLRVTVTILGTGVTSGSGTNYKSYVTKGEVRIGSNNWVTVHNGDEDSVTPGKVVYTADAKKGDKIYFRSQYYNGGWSTSRTESSSEVRILTNGERVPSNKPDNDAVKSAEDFLKPHMNEDGTLKLGDLDIIYAAELTHTNKQDSGYDLQDLIVHVSFSRIEKN